MLRKLIAASSAMALAGVLAVTVPAAAEASGATSDDRSVRVMSFNIHHGADHAEVLNLERIAQDIESNGAEVIGLQEVDSHWGARSGFVDQAEWLADRLDMNVAYGPNLDRDPEPGQTERAQYGNAVLSSHEIVRARNHLLTFTVYPERPSEQRGLLETVIEIRGKQISFYATHLDSRRVEERQKEVADILEIVKSHSRPAVLVGDLNALPSGPEVQTLMTEFKDVFAELGKGGEFTYPAETPTARIDYILTRGEIGIRTATVIQTQSSDHLPVIADLTIGEND